LLGCGISDGISDGNPDGNGDGNGQAQDAQSDRMRRFSSSGDCKPPPETRGTAQ